MIHDYCPSQTVKKKKAVLAKKIKINHRLVFIFALVFGALFLAFIAIKIELKGLYQLKENERILLIKNNKPMAMVYFNVNNKQLVLTDLSQNNFDFAALEKSATLSSQLKKNLIYTFLFDTAFDQSYEYPYEDLSRESLLSFFKNQNLRVYYFFLKDRDLLWKEQRFEKQANSVNQTMFNCSVALVNTTNESGLASTLATILEKNSFSIIKKDSNSDNLSQTKIVYNPEEKTCSRLIEKLGRVFGESLVIANKNEAESYRSSMVIYVGRDLADLYLFFIDLFHGQL